jgi:hypothetical protein
MKRGTVITATPASGAVLAAPASAEIVRAPIGASSKLKLNASTSKTLKKHRVSVTSSGSAKKSGSTLSLPYSLSRWDFAAREGDVVHFKKNTGLKFKRAGGPSIAMTHPRVILDGRNGYVTALISNVRVKTFTFSRSSGKVTDTATSQRISGLRLKLTKASALFLNQGLKRKVLKSFTQFGTLELNILKPAAPQPGGAGGPGGTSTPVSVAPGQGTTPGGTATFGTGIRSALPAGSAVGPVAPGIGVDTNGDGQADAGVFALPLKSTTFNATTRTGTIVLDGGLVVRANGQDVVALRNPEIVVGATPASSGLFALINGVRVQVGDVDLNSLKVNLLDGTVTVSDLDVKVNAAGISQLGLIGVLPGADLLKLNLSLPQL